LEGEAKKRGRTGGKNLKQKTRGGISREGGAKTPYNRPERGTQLERSEQKGDQGEKRVKNKEKGWGMTYKVEGETRYKS